MALKLFIDFDGTVTRDDVGNVFFRTFGGDQCDTLVSAYRGGDISAHACFRGETAALGEIEEDSVVTFLHTIEMREGGSGLFSLCRRLGIECYVVSDGLDYYIRTILADNHIDGVPFFANTFQLFPNGNGRTVPSIRFPFANAECDRCACCKRNIMMRFSGPDDIIAYVGDGFSDRCPVQYADIVYARGELQTFCQEQNISYLVYHSLDEVGHHLEGLLQRKHLRKRARAEVQRQRLFIGEA